MILAAAIFIILGLAIKYGKLYFLIAGYNTMSREEQEKIDIVGVAALMCNIFLAMGVGVLVFDVIALWLGMPMVSTVAFFAITVIGVVYLLAKANSRKFKKE